MNDEIIDVSCSREENLKRIEICTACDDRVLLNHAPSCSHCNCSISLLTTVNFKTCPIGKW